MLRKGANRILKFLLGIKYFPPPYHTSTILFHAVARVIHDSWHYVGWNIPKGCARDFIKNTASHETSRKYISLSAPHYLALSSRYLVSATWDPVTTSRALSVPQTPSRQHARKKGPVRDSNLIPAGSFRQKKLYLSVAFLFRIPLHLASYAYLIRDVASSSHWSPCSRDWCMNSGLSITRCLPARRCEIHADDHRFLFSAVKFYIIC